MCLILDQYRNPARFDLAVFSTPYRVGFEEVPTQRWFVAALDNVRACAGNSSLAANHESKPAKTSLPPIEMSASFPVRSVMGSIGGTGGCNR